MKRFWSCDEHALTIHFPPFFAVRIGQRWYAPFHHAWASGVALYVCRWVVYEKYSLTAFN